VPACKTRSLKRVRVSKAGPKTQHSAPESPVLTHGDAAPPRFAAIFPRNVHRAMYNPRTFPTQPSKHGILRRRLVNSDPIRDVREAQPQRERKKASRALLGVLLCADPGAERDCGQTDTE
jgi:hypothetical protein